MKIAETTFIKYVYSIGVLLRDSRFSQHWSSVRGLLVCDTV